MPENKRQAKHGIFFCAVCLHAGSRSNRTHVCKWKGKGEISPLQQGSLAQGVDLMNATNVTNRRHNFVIGSDKPYTEGGIDGLREMLHTHLELLRKATVAEPYHQVGMGREVDPRSSATSMQTNMHTYLAVVEAMTEEVDKDPPAQEQKKKKAVTAALARVMKAAIQVELDDRDKKLHREFRVVGTVPTKKVSTLVMTDDWWREQDHRKGGAAASVSTSQLQDACSSLATKRPRGCGAAAAAVSTTSTCIPESGYGEGELYLWEKNISGTKKIRFSSLAPECQDLLRKMFMRSNGSETESESDTESVKSSSAADRERRPSPSPSPSISTAQGAAALSSLSVCYARD